MARAPSSTVVLGIAGVLALAPLVGVGPIAAFETVGRGENPRKAYVAGPLRFPPDVPTALRILRRAHTAGNPQTRTDIDFVLRLWRTHGRHGQPIGRRRTVARTLRVNAWWYRSHQSPVDRILVRDPVGIISTYWEGRGFGVNPVATTGRWQGLNAGVPVERLADALLPLAVARRGGGRPFLLWEYYDVPDRPGTIRPGASGMAQGRVAQLMAKAYHRTGEPRFASAAGGALRAFLVGVNAGGVKSRVVYPPGTRSRPWYVERAFPGESPWKGAALNGFMVSLLNLDATAALLGSRPRAHPSGVPRAGRPARTPGAVRLSRMAEDLGARGVVTLRHYLPLHDTGSWSLYGLLTPNYGWRGFEADAGYHCYHVDLLRQIDDSWPRRGFAKVASRWEGYARRRGVRCE